jgi:hypothetical protein
MGIFAVLCLAGCATRRPARPEPSAPPNILRSQTIEDAAVTTEAQAQRLALGHIVNADGGFSATAGLRFGLCFRLDFPIPGFARVGERIWQMVHTAHFVNARRIIWINAETGAVKVLADSGTTCARPVEYDGDHYNRTGELVPIAPRGD